MKNGLLTRGGAMYASSLAKIFLFILLTGPLGLKAGNPPPDNIPPVAICDDLVNVTLTSQGTAVVYATVFDEGSYDNLCLASLEVKRMGEPDGAYAGYIVFNCDDIGAPVQVVLRATDCAGNTNTCWSEAVVEDKSAPSIHCPYNVTVVCNTNIDDTAITGTPDASDACGLAGVTFFDQEFFDNCNTGYLIRTFTAEDIYGMISSCTQTITVVDTTAVTVEFPEDYTLTGCLSLDDLHPDNLPAPFDRPVVSGEDCEVTASNWDDLVFIASGNSCVKVLRTWTVIDWCNYGQPGDPGFFQDTQILKIQDDEAPTFTCSPDLSVPILGPHCVTTVELPPLTDIEDCLDETSVHISGDLPGAYVHTDVGPGTYEITYTVTDGCNNSASCSFTVTVSDANPPGITCLNGLSTALMPSGMIALSAEDFVQNVFDNCTATDAIELRLGPDPAPGQTTPPDGDELIFTCDNLGTNIVGVWAGDAAGNWDFCETYVIITDNNNVCIPMAMISGVIHDEVYSEVGGVAIMINEDSSYLQMTEADGQYLFTQMPMGAAYTIRPEKNDDYGNGISTMDIVRLVRHLLNVEPLSSPYKRIAADVNGSGHISVQDIIALQQMVLGIDDTFADNASWRFVDEGYVFPDPEDPFLESWPEVKVVPNLADNMLDGNFMAVKIGDLDLSANHSAFASVEERDRLDLQTDDRQLTAGQTIRVPVRTGEATGLLGFQGTFDLDPAVLSFLGSRPGALSDLDAANLGRRFLAEGALTVSWATAREQVLAAGSVLFELEFRVLRDGRLRDALSFNSLRTAAEAYRNEDSPKHTGLGLVFASPEAEPAAGSRVFPNPFADRTLLTFRTPAEGPVRLSVWNAQGRQVYGEQRRLPAGEQQWTLQADWEWGSGPLFYELRTAAGISRGKLLRLE